MRRQILRLSIVVSLIVLTLASSILPQPTPLLAGGGYPPVTVSLVPSSKTVQPGETFTVDVRLEMQPNSHAVSIVKFVWSFADHVLEATSISLSPPFTYLEQLPLTPNIGEIGFAASAGLNAVQNSMTVATITFRAAALGNRSTQINWDVAQVLSLSPWDTAIENVVGTTSAASICVTTCPGGVSFIGGRISDANAAVLSGINVSVVGPTSQTITTDVYGDYFVRNVAAGTYTITPFKSGYTFSPASRIVVIPPGASFLDFTGTPQTSSQTIDLEVTSIESPSTPICAGSSPNFYAYIRNNGTLASGDFAIRWFNDGEAHDGGHSSIAAGATDTQGSIWDTIPLGEHTLTFIADVYGQITETNESNNQQTITFLAIDCLSEDTTKPGGTWIAPSNDFVVTDNHLHLEVHAYDNLGGSGIEKVNFTALYSGQWHIVSTDTSPEPGTDIYSYDWDLSNIPIGTISVSFDVYDKAGNYNLAPNGTRPGEILLCSDVDDDALCDTWEVYGYNGVDLPSMGADPNHKDIFVEIDYMVDPSRCTFGDCKFGHSHKPKHAAIEKIIKSFKDAPVSNPDNIHGINLHVDYGPESTMMFSKGKPVSWGKFSQSNSLPHEDNISLQRLREIKQKPDNFDINRTRIFHYGIFGHYLEGTDCGGGIANYGTDFLVTLGGWIDFNDTCLGSFGYLATGSVNQQAGTFMHEFGHNLGLLHGGLDGINHKPNYLSIMNYMYSTKGLIIDGKEGNFDYAQSDNIPDLNEAHLNELVGLDGGSSTANYGVRWFCNDSNHSTTLANSFIDWNCNKSMDDLVQTNINGNSYPPESVFRNDEVLKTWNDWVNLDYTSNNLIRPNAGKKIQRMEKPSDELTFAEERKLPSPYQVSLSGTAELQAQANMIIVYSFTLYNSGYSPDTYTITASSSRGWSQISTIPSSINLLPGRSFEILVTINIPASAMYEEADDLEVVAVSQANPQISDAAYVHITKARITLLPLVQKR